MKGKELRAATPETRSGLPKVNDRAIRVKLPGETLHDLGGLALSR